MDLHSGERKCLLVTGDILRTRVGQKSALLFSGIKMELLLWQ